MGETKVEKVLSRADFDTFDVTQAYSNEVDHYPTYAEQDAGRQKVLDWVVSQLEGERRLNPEAEIQCIDVGCVHGKPTVELLAKHGYRVVGLDLPTKLLEVARHSGIANAEFAEGDVREWEPVQKGKIDCVTCFYVISHFALDEYPVVFGRISEWLRPRGVFALGTILDFNGWKQFERTKAPISSCPTQEMSHILKQQQFEVVDAYEEDWQSPARPDRDPRRHQFFLCRKRQ